MAGPARRPPSRSRGATPRPVSPRVAASVGRRAAGARGARGSEPTSRPAGDASGSRRWALTGRAAILGLVLATVALALVVPTRVFIGQRHQIAGLLVQQRAEQAAVAQLQKQSDLLHNPAYVEAQASERLNFVLPGQTLVQVYGPVASPVTAKVSARRAAAARPWYSRLWQSVVVADTVYRPAVTRR